MLEIGGVRDYPGAHPPDMARGDSSLAPIFCSGTVS